MKACPKCKRNYADDSLIFCLDDGSLLSAKYDPDATLVMNPTPTSPQPGPTVPSIQPPRPAAPYPMGSAAQPSSGHPHLIYAIAGLLAVVIVVAGLALVAYIRFSSSGTTSANYQPTPSSVSQPSPSPSHTAMAYQKNGLNFSYFSDWSVATDNAIGKTDARAIHIEGPNSAVVSLICLPASNSATLEDFVAAIAKDRPQVMKEELQSKGLSGSITENGGTEPVVGNVQGKPQTGLRQRFSIEVADTKTPHEQDFYMVVGSRYKIMISAQVADENREQARSDWQLIFDTLKEIDAH